MAEFCLDGVPSYTQVDNVYSPYVSCFPTSLAMAIDYCLMLIGKEKIDVGCAEDMQLEDYINLIIDDPETIAYFKENQVKYGSWILKYFKNKNARTVFAVEEYVFNRLMNEHGFTAKVNTALTYEEYCQHIETFKMPIILGGDFSSIKRADPKAKPIEGHMNCGIGFNSTGLKEVIVNDPYGNALEGYPKLEAEEMEAEAVRYPIKFFVKKDTMKMWGLMIFQI
jgi:hypothetical protein